MMSDLADSSPPIPSVQESRVADEPFNNKAADVILRTSDKVDFYVFKSILSLASPVFESMFSLPQPVSAPGPSKEGDHAASHPVIDVSEDSLTLNSVLHLCYPVYRPNLKKLKDVGPVLLAACKYDMKVVLAVAKTALRQCIQQDVLGVFALAIRCELYGICSKAAKQFLQRPFLSLESEQLDHITADKYRLLLDYHQRYAEDKTFTIPRRAWSDKQRLEGQPSMSSPASSITTHFTPPPLEASEPRDADAPFDDQTADIVLRSSDQVDFRAHSFILSFASPVFQGMILGCQQGLSAETHSAGDEAQRPPVINVPEDSRTLDFILRLCYPVHLPPLTQLSEARLVFAAGLKYGIDGVKAFVEAAFADLVDQDVLGVWCFALRYKLRNLSTLAAKHSLQHSCTSLDSTELSYISARQYHKLLQYRKRCGAVASAVTSSRTWFNDLPDGPSTVHRCSCDVQDWEGRGDWYAPSELWTFLGAAKGALEVRPCGLTVLSNEVLSKWTMSFCSANNNDRTFYGGGSNDCSQIYTRDNKFAQALAREVDRVVAEVEVPSFF